MKAPHYFIYFSLFLFLSASKQERKPLKITFTNVKDTQSTIRVGVYRSQDNFPKGDIAYKGYEIKPEGKNTVVLSITDLEYGEYAIAIYQDKNGDKKLNTGMFGIPKEPYAFSNNFKPTFSAPKFSDCKFDYKAGKNEISIALLD